MKIPKQLLLRSQQFVPLLSKSVPSSIRSASFIADAVSADTLERAKPFDEVPGPKSYPLLGNIPRYLPKIGDYDKKTWHEAQKKKFEQYGFIVREEMIPGYFVVHLFDVKDMEVVSWNEGKYPKREFFVAMRKMRDGNPDMYSTAGVAAANGEEWHKQRVKSQSAMLKPAIMKMFLPQMNVIADDLIRRIRLLRQPDHQVPGLLDELFKWAMESVCFILFNQRLGCLDDAVTPDSLSQQYIRAVNQFFKLSAKVELSSFPIWQAYPALSPSYQKLKKVHDFFFEHAMDFVTKRIEALEKEGSESGRGSLMEMLLKTCSPKDASVMAVDAMAAGIDTTSITLAYVLRNLALNPSAQKKLQEEVDQKVPQGQPLTEEALDTMSYMRACIKESMRINPTVQGTSRTLEKDIVLSGYRIPANTLLTLNYNVSSLLESNFEDAEKYMPERWLRSAKGVAKTKDSFAFVPFGFGPRMCIGRRIADLEMMTLLTKIMQNFWIKNPNDELEINFQLVLMIKSPLRYEFYERQQV